MHSRGRQIPGVAFLVGVGAFALLACATVPETGRRQLLVVSASEEAQLGADAFGKLKQEKRVSQNAAANAQVRRVGQRIASVVSVPHAQWEFVVFEDDTPNAFALPGGKVGVNTGILPITQTDAGLAAVIGHEVAHVVARHGGERMSQNLLTSLGGTALDVGLGVGAGVSPQARRLAMGAFGVGTQVGVLLPYSRAHEIEADRLGMIYMARAGYDPREAVAFWERMARYKAGDGGGRGVPSILSTHPVDSDRIANLQRYLPEAMAQYRGAR